MRLEGAKSKSPLFGNKIRPILTTINYGKIRSPAVPRRMELNKSQTNFVFIFPFLVIANSINGNLMQRERKRKLRLLSQKEKPQKRVRVW